MKGQTIVLYDWKKKLKQSTNNVSQPASQPSNQWRSRAYFTTLEAKRNIGTRGPGQGTDFVKVGEGRKEERTSFNRCFRGSWFVGTLSLAKCSPSGCHCSLLYELFLTVSERSFAMRHAWNQSCTFLSFTFVQSHIDNENTFI
jgi:hypothetical protein